MVTQTWMDFLLPLWWFCFSLVNYVSPSGYIPSSRYQNCHFHRFVESLCPVSSQHLPKCLFIAVPHSINCWSSHAKTLLFRDFKTNLVDDVSMICGEKTNQGWKGTCSEGQPARVFLYPVSIMTFWVSQTVKECGQYLSVRETAIILCVQRR